MQTGVATLKISVENLKKLRVSQPNGPFLEPLACALGTEHPTAKAFLTVDWPWKHAKCPSADNG